MNHCPSRRNVRTCVKRLEKRGMLARHADPYTCIHEKIEFVCSVDTTHRFFWDLDEIVGRLKRSRRNNDTLCPDCVSRNSIVRDHCREIRVCFVCASARCCTIRTPSCGHDMELSTEAFLKMSSAPPCISCGTRNIYSLLRKLDVVRSKGVPFHVQDVSMLLQDVLRILSSLSIQCPSPFCYDEEARDLLLTMCCPHEHENTTTLRGVMSLLISVGNGHLSSPCPDCHMMTSS